jgi:hypothetical protein
MNTRLGMRLIGLVAALLIGMISALAATRDVWEIRMADGGAMLFLGGMFAAWVVSSLVLGSRRSSGVTGRSQRNGQSLTK